MEGEKRIDRQAVITILRRKCRRTIKRVARAREGAAIQEPLCAPLWIAASPAAPRNDDESERIASPPATRLNVRRK